MAPMKKSKNPELPNRHQKLARRPGEHRVGSEQIAELLEFSLSDDAEERLEAAENLCPCTCAPASTRSGMPSIA